MEIPAYERALPERWLPGMRSIRDAHRTRLYCFPYAGGGGSAFAPFRSIAGIDVLAVEYPARETRWGDTPHDTIDDLVDALAADLASLWTGNFAFWGHSFGALIAFELTRRLRKLGYVLPQRLFVSGAPAPHLPPRDPIHDLAPVEFLRKLLTWNGVPREVLENRELLALALPIVRHDFRLFEQYRFADAEPLPVPLSAFGGLKDPHVAVDHLLAWSAHTSRTCHSRFLPGDHFFAFRSVAAMSGYLQTDLAATEQAFEEVTVGRTE